MNIPTDIKTVFDEIVAQAKDDDKSNVQKALELAWADERAPGRKSHILESWENLSFYSARMTLETNGAKSRWKVELSVKRA